MPNFSLPAPPIGPEDEPVVLWTGLGHIRDGAIHYRPVRDHVQPCHWLSHVQQPLQAQFHLRGHPPWLRTGTWGTPT